MDWEKMISSHDICSECGQRITDDETSIIADDCGVQHYRQHPCWDKYMSRLVEASEDVEEMTAAEVTAWFRRDESKA